MFIKHFIWQSPTNIIPGQIPPGQNILHKCETNKITPGVDIIKLNNEFLCE